MTSNISDRVEGQPTWKARLGSEIPEDLGREIDIFEMQIQLRKQGKLEEKLFAETRLRRGAYGQRYDNGQRDDGAKIQELPYPPAQTKGPSTVWHAPGMQRIKIPYGGLSAKQLEVLSEVAEEYSDSILHITTRQDVQLHFIHIEDTPDLMRRLASAGITTREACGNTVRNVTACQLAGVCTTETFDVSPYAHAMTYFLLGHADAQDFGRKFKVAFSGCAENACGLANMHDVGCIARTREVDGRTKRGFEYYVGGGLGAVPHQAKVFDEFVAEEDLLPLTQAICRVFARLGEKKNRGKARLKFLVQKLGFEEFKRLVLEERERIPFDERWTSYIESVPAQETKPLKGPEKLVTLGKKAPDGYEAWARTNVMAQKQEGYAVATVNLPLGDLTSDQGRELARIARRYCGDNLRTTVEQNIVLRWVSEADLPALYRELDAAGLGLPGAGTLLDVTACPGTDTCKLGIASSRGLAAELRHRLAEKQIAFDQAVENMRIKVSGCFNSCGQHHVSELGFYGVSRKKGTRLVPHFQVMLGGEWANNAGAFGLASGAVPSKNIPAVVERMLEHYLGERDKGETFNAYIKRIGKGKARSYFDDLVEVPAYDVDPSYYSDWGDAREYNMKDYGIGECAGEVVPLAEFGLAASEREAFEAQLHLDENDLQKAAEMAYKAMLTAARALVEIQYLDITRDPGDIVREFKARYHDTQKFHDTYAGGKFASYLFRVHEDPTADRTPDEIHRRVEEATLFIEAAQSCYNRMVQKA